VAVRNHVLLLCLSAVRRWAALRVATSRPGRDATVAGDGALPPLPGWAWPLCWAVVAVAVGLLVRLPGPAILDPDEHASVLYFDRLVAGQRLEEPLLSAPKPLLTVVHGLAWRAGHDWRLLTAVTVAAFALAVVCLARAAGRLGGPAAAAAILVAVAGSGPLVLQTARGNSVIFAMAGWSVAVDALTRGPGAPQGGPKGPGVGAGAAWGVAAAALALAGLARAETWPLLPLAAGWGLLAWWPSRRPPSRSGGSGRHGLGGGDRRAVWLVLPLVVPLLWLGHDWLLTGDPLFSLRVPGRYTDLVSGRQVIPPGAWLALVGRRYAPDPLVLALAAVGVVWLVRRRAWVWLAFLAVTSVGLLALLGLEARGGTYISFRYFDPADLAVRLAAALGAAALATAATTALAGRLGGRLADRGRRPDPAAAAGRGRRAGLAAAAGVVAAVLVGAACWPLAPDDPQVDWTLDRGARLSANTATAIAALAPLAARPGTVLTVSGPERVRVAVELDLPLGRVRDLFLATRATPLDRALAGSDAVFHDADGDQPASRFAPLSTTDPARVGEVKLVPIRTDPGRGLYVHRVEGPGAAGGG
jgi:hypothetical protein